MNEYSDHSDTLSVHDYQSSLQGASQDSFSVSSLSSCGLSVASLTSFSRDVQSHASGEAEEEDDLDRASSPVARGQGKAGGQRAAGGISASRDAYDIETEETVSLPAMYTLPEKSLRLRPAAHYTPLEAPGTAAAASRANLQGRARTASARTQALKSEEAVPSPSLFPERPTSVADDTEKSAIQQPGASAGKQAEVQPAGRGAARVAAAAAARAKVAGDAAMERKKLLRSGSQFSSGAASAHGAYAKQGGATAVRALRQALPTGRTSSANAPTSLSGKTGGGRRSRGSVSRQRGLPAENAAGDKGAIGRLIPSRRETLDDRAYRAVAGVSSKQQTADKNGVDGWEESVAL